MNWSPPISIRGQDLLPVALAKASRTSTPLTLIKNCCSTGSSGWPAGSGNPMISLNSSISRVISPQGNQNVQVRGFHRSAIAWIKSSVDGSLAYCWCHLQPTVIQVVWEHTREGGEPRIIPPREERTRLDDPLIRGSILNLTEDMISGKDSIWGNQTPFENDTGAKKKMRRIR